MDNDYTNMTLKELLMHESELVRRNAISILKYYQKKKQQGYKCYLCGSNYPQHTCYNR